MQYRHILLLISLFILTGCSSPEIAAESTQPSATEDWAPVTLPPTWTSMPTASLTPSPSPEVEITPAATSTSFDATLAAPTEQSEQFLPFTRIKMINSLEGWAWDTDLVWRAGWMSLRQISVYLVTR